MNDSNDSIDSSEPNEPSSPNGASRRSALVVVGLGANLGDRHAALSRAVAAIATTPGVRVAARSRVYETRAVGPAQPDYLNAAILVECTIALDALLTALLATEAAHGRERKERWGPRTIDLDVLLAGETICDTPGLTVPHPRLHERAFAVLPLLDVAPDAADPRTKVRYADLVLADRADVTLTPLPL